MFDVLGFEPSALEGIPQQQTDEIPRAHIPRRHPSGEEHHVAILLRGMVGLHTGGQFQPANMRMTPRGGRKSLKMWRWNPQRTAPGQAYTSQNYQCAARARAKTDMGGHPACAMAHRHPRDYCPLHS